MNITSESIENSHISDIRTHEINNESISIEDRVKNYYSTAMLEVENHTLSRDKYLEHPGDMSPEELAAIQNKIGEYNIKVSTISTLTRKTVAAIDTLLRA